METEKQEKFDWTKSIKSTISRMKIIGLWPREDSYKPDLYTLWSMFCIIFLVGSPTFFQLVNLRYIIDDIQSLTSSIYVDLSEIICLQKAYLVTKNIKMLKNLITTANSDLFQPKNERQKRQVEVNMRFWVLNSRVYWTSLFVAIFFWSVTPIFDKFGEYRLPFLAWYPFDYKTSPYYEIVYIYQVIGVMANACTALTTDTLIAALHVYIASQFDILCDDLRHLNETTQETTSSLSKKLSNCVNHHRAILRFAEDLAKFSNWIIFGQFFVSTLSIAVTMFQLSTADPFSTNFFAIVVFIVTLTSEIFLFCYFGNEVELKFQSLNISYALFECDWLNASAENRAIIIIMIERCKRPLKVSALNLFYLSLETFMKIIRASWSYFALLHQLTNEK